MTNLFFSWCDHVLTLSQDNIRDIRSLDSVDNNFSDHLPLEFSVNLNVTGSVTKSYNASLPSSTHKIN